jgi:hypothetical protein
MYQHATQAAQKAQTVTKVLLLTSDATAGNELFNRPGFGFAILTTICARCVRGNAHRGWKTAIVCVV